MKKYYLPLIALLTLSSSIFAENTLLDLLGDKRTNADGQPVAAHSANITGVYFSAHWCPPCRAFTPILVNTYNLAKANGMNFNIVFVSADRSEEDMLTYMKEAEMPWLAVPHNSDASKAAIHYKSGKLGSGSIPFLVILDADGNIITKEGRNDVSSFGVDAIKKWNAKASASK